MDSFADQEFAQWLEQNVADFQMHSEAKNLDVYVEWNTNLLLKLLKSVVANRPIGRASSQKKSEEFHRALWCRPPRLVSTKPRLDPFSTRVSDSTKGFMFSVVHQTSTFTVSWTKEVRTLYDR